MPNPHVLCANNGYALFVLHRGMADNAFSLFNWINVKPLWNTIDSSCHAIEFPILTAITSLNMSPLDVY